MNKDHRDTLLSMISGNLYVRPQELLAGSPESRFLQSWDMYEDMIESIKAETYTLGHESLEQLNWGREAKATREQSIWREYKS